MWCVSRVTCLVPNNKNNNNNNNTNNLFAHCSNHNTRRPYSYIGTINNVYIRDTGKCIVVSGY